MNRKDELLDKTTADLFPPSLGARCLAQDLGVGWSSREISDLLEAHHPKTRSKPGRVTTKPAARPPWPRVARSG
jgi:hypothetical protein